MSTIAVTQPEYHKAKAVFEAARGRGFTCVCAPEHEAELAATITRLRARHAVVGVAKYQAELYQALPRGGVLARFGVGHDGVDKAAATGAGILCTNTPGVLDDSVAELALGLMLAAARWLPDLTHGTHAGEWPWKLGGELRGRTLAIIGVGAIGSRVARVAAVGFGMRVVGCESRPMDADATRAQFGIERVTPDFAEAVRDADFVSLHIPNTPETRYFLDAGRLSCVPAKAWVINTARGAVVDETALYDALNSVALAGAALDVFEAEPYTPVDAARDLRMLPNIIMTPHIGSSTQEACARMAERALLNIELAERGEVERMDLLNREVLRDRNS